MDTMPSPRFAIAAALLLAVAGAIAAPKATLRVQDAWSRATRPPTTRRSSACGWTHPAACANAWPHAWWRTPCARPDLTAQCAPAPMPRTVNVVVTLPASRKRSVAVNRSPSTSARLGLMNIRW